MKIVARLYIVLATSWVVLCGAFLFLATNSPVSDPFAQQSTTGVHGPWERYQHADVAAKGDAVPFCFAGQTLLWQRCVPNETGIVVLFAAFAPTLFFGGIVWAVRGFERARRI